MQWLVVVVVVTACFSAACVTVQGLTVTGLDSVALEPRGASHLVVVAGSAAEADRVAALVVSAARGGYFTAEHRLVDGANADGALELRVDAVTSTTEAVTLTREAGNIAGVRARVAVRFSITNAAGEVVVDDRRVEQIMQRPAADAVDVVGLAASAAAAEIVAIITPRTTSQFLPFDGGDSGQASIIGEDTLSLAEREQRLRAYISSRKGNAIAHFNLAVVLDAQQRFEDAMIEQDRALDLELRTAFFDARSETIRRRDAWERVHGPRPPRTVAETQPSTSTSSVEMATSTQPLSAPLPTTMSSEPLTAPIGATAPTIDDG